MNSTSGTPASTEKDPRRVIFVVDDEAMLLELNAIILEPLGYRVLSFVDPVAAVRAYLLSEPRPALVITDYAMLGMNGLDVISACRRVNPTQKVIMISGTVDESTFQDAVEKPDYFLAKPYLSHQLTDLVRDLLAE